MARNKVMQLWTAFATAFLALCAALGLVATTAGPAAATPSVPQTGTARNSGDPVLPQGAMPSWAAPAHTRSLPPTMKQRIRAEAHGKTPTCRHLAPAETEESAAGSTAADSDSCAPDADGGATGPTRAHPAGAAAATTTTTPLQR